MDAPRQYGCGRVDMSQGALKTSDLIRGTMTSTGMNALH
jgi:hypothetical protein